MSKHAAERIRIKYPFRSKPGKRVPEKVARPTRGSVQYAAGFFLGAWLNQQLPHLIDHQRAVVIGACMAFVNYVWVAIEDHYGAGLLRQVPPTTAPVVDEGR